METGCLHVSDLVLSPVVRVSPHLHLKGAARVLAATGVGTLVVDSDPMTEVSEHDIVRAVALGAATTDEIVDIVRDRPDFVGTDTPVEIAAQVLLDAGRRGVIVVDDAGTPVGVLTLAPVITAIVGRASWIGALRIALEIDGRV